VLRLGRQVTSSFFMAALGVIRQQSPSAGGRCPARSHHPPVPM
jgi:hypothetical protein